MEPATPAVYDDANVERIMQAWGGTPTADKLAERMRWRDKRLAALRAHKREQAEM